MPRLTYRALGLGDDVGTSMEMVFDTIDAMDAWMAIWAADVEIRRCDGEPEVMAASAPMTPTTSMEDAFSRIRRKKR